MKNNLLVRRAAIAALMAVAGVICLSGNPSADIPENTLAARTFQSNMQEGVAGYTFAAAYADSETDVDSTLVCDTGLALSMVDVQRAKLTYKVTTYYLGFPAGYDSMQSYLVVERSDDDLHWTRTDSILVNDTLYHDTDTLIMRPYKSLRVVQCPILPWGYGYVVINPDPTQWFWAVLKYDVVILDKRRPCDGQ